MRIHHIGLVCGSEEQAERFYHHLLGLERTRSYAVPAEVSRGLFGFDRTYRAYVYGKGGVTLEVFVVEGAPTIHPHLHHVGLEVEDLKGFLERCREMGVEVLEVAKEGKTVTMIRDFDGNLFEIKEKA